MSCYRYKGIFIPECISAAIHGPDSCTCFWISVNYSYYTNTVKVFFGEYIDKESELLITFLMEKLDYIETERCKAYKSIVMYFPAPNIKDVILSLKSIHPIKGKLPKKLLSNTIKELNQLKIPKYVSCSKQQ